MRGGEARLPIKTRGVGVRLRTEKGGTDGKVTQPVRRAYSARVETRPGYGRGEVRGS